MVQVPAETLRMLIAEPGRLRVDGWRKVGLSPWALMPAIEAYAAEEISGGKLRECLALWLAGADFQDPAQRDWEETDGRDE